MSNLKLGRYQVPWRKYQTTWPKTYGNEIDRQIRYKPLLGKVYDLSYVNGIEVSTKFTSWNDIGIWQIVNFLYHYDTSIYSDLSSVIGTECLLVIFSIICNGVAPVFFWGVKFHQILTWKIWFWPVQRIFHGKNGPNSSNFDFDFFSRLSDFCDKFQRVVKNTEGFCFFLL